MMYDICHFQYNSVLEDVKRDIRHFVHVDEETQEMCRSEFMAHSDVPMRVCGLCGIRDPDRKYTAIPLDDCISTDWLLVRQEARTRLEALPPIQLLRRSESGDLVDVEVPVIDFYNMFTPDPSNSTRTYHVVPEACFSENQTQCTFSCDKCYRHRGKGNLATPRPSRLGNNGQDTFDDLYFEIGKNGAPSSSIAGGEDYGRQSFLLNKHGIQPPSTLEALVLAKARTHYVAVKIVANGHETHASRLNGATITFPHEPVLVNQDTKKSLTSEMIRAAATSLKVLPCV